MNRFIALIALCLSLSPLAQAAHEETLLPQGYYVSEDGDLTMRITKSGFFRPDFGVLLPNGTKTTLNFPRKLRYDEEEEAYRTRGETSLVWYTTIGAITCSYPLSAQVEALGDGARLRVRITMPQQMSIDTWGRCLSLGQRTQTIRFEREDAH
jgi:hypothetical protein